MSTETDTKGWRYAINYGPDGEENWANVYDSKDQLVGNLRTYHAVQIVAMYQSLASWARDNAQALQSARQQGLEQGRRAGMEEAAGIAKRTADHEEQARLHAAEIKSDEASYRLWTRQTADGIAAAILAASQSPTPKEA